MAGFGQSELMEVLPYFKPVTGDAFAVYCGH